MTIQGRDLIDVQNALTQSSTTESDFRGAGVNVAVQVDTNQMELAADRTITLMGDVTSPELTYNITDRAISITTSIKPGVIETADIAQDAITGELIADNSITSMKIEDGAVTNRDIDSDSKMNFQVRASNGDVIFQLDGLRIIT